MAPPVEGEGEVELDHGLRGQVAGGEHLQSLDQLHHGVVVLEVRAGRRFLLLSHQRLLPGAAVSYLDVSVGEQQVHDDVLGQDLRVVDAELDAGQLLGQLLALVFLSGLSDVVQQSVFEGGAVKTRLTPKTYTKPPTFTPKTLQQPSEVDTVELLGCVSPGRDVDVLQQAGEAVREGDAERRQQVVPVGLHVLAGPALGVALAARVLVVGGDDVGDEVVVPTGGLKGGNTHVCVGEKRDERDGIRAEKRET